LVPRIFDHRIPGTLSTKSVALNTNANLPRGRNGSRSIHKMSMTSVRYDSGMAARIAKLRNSIFEGECLSVMEMLADSSVDMILCDLPYGTTQNHWDSVIPLDKLWESYRRILKPNGVVALTSQGVFTAKLMLSNQKHFKYKLVWVKSKPTNFLNAKKQPLRRHEDICVFYAKQPIYKPQMSPGDPYDKGIRKKQLSGSYGDFNSVHVKSGGERYPTDVLYFKTAESEGAVVHPTQKPVELGRYLIRTFTNPGDVILDNTCGSGSFLLSAALEGRDYIGIELNEGAVSFKNVSTDWIQVADKRLSSQGFQSHIYRQGDLVGITRIQ